MDTMDAYDEHFDQKLHEDAPDYHETGAQEEDDHHRQGGGGELVRAESLLPLSMSALELAMLPQSPSTASRLDMPTLSASPSQQQMAGPPGITRSGSANARMEIPTLSAAPSTTTMLPGGVSSSGLDHPSMDF
jgi:hypothetical protein